MTGGDFGVTVGVQGWQRHVQGVTGGDLGWQWVYRGDRDMYKGWQEKTLGWQWVYRGWHREAWEDGGHVQGMIGADKWHKGYV